MMEDSKPIPGIVLAAGESRRMGQFKPLLPLGSRTVLQHVADRLLESGVSPILVILGHRAEEVERCLADLPTRTIFNADYRSGMLSSVQCGVRRLPEDAPGFLLAMGDQPLLSVAVVKSILQAWRDRPGDVVSPRSNGASGHPVLIDRNLFDRILDLKEPRTLRDVTHAPDILRREVPVASPIELLDLDIPSDYEIALRSIRASI